MDSPHGNEPGRLCTAEVLQVLDEPCILCAVLAEVHVCTKHHNMGWSHLKTASAAQRSEMHVSLNGNGCN